MNDDDEVFHVECTEYAECGYYGPQTKIEFRGRHEAWGLGQIFTQVELRDVWREELDPQSHPDHIPRHVTEMIDSMIMRLHRQLESAYRARAKKSPMEEPG